ncbi:MAG: hypothetical protein E7551_09740 [Ruminococcaceae bacterium]|nr:hypothetical protein [Oscillospiraceae bacterium]
MKKFFGFLLAICLVAMLVVTPIGVAAEGQDVDINMGEGVEFTPGDIDGDGNINLNDLVTIAQVQANWPGVGYVEAALDTDGSGTFELLDVNYLAQYLAGWNVVLNDVAYVA